MKYISKDERLKLIGFNDLKLMLVTIPILGFLFPLLVFKLDPTENWLSYAIVFVISMFHIFTFWYVDRWIVIFFRKKINLFKDYQKRLLLQAISVFVMTSLLSHAAKSPMFCPQEYVKFLDVPYIYMFSVSLILTIFILFMYESKYVFELVKEGLVRNEILSKQNAQAQLESLKNQVNPHFLFNSLNTLVSVIPESPDIAVRFTENLSSVYRHILEIKDKEIITLKEELNCINAYNYLLKIRFGDHIQIVYEKFDDTGGKYIIPLSIQLLIENAIKHNIVSSSRPLIITLTLNENEIVVSNNKQLKINPEKSTKIGLENINKRYSLLIKKRIKIEESDTIFSVRLPIVKMNELK